MLQQRTTISEISVRASRSENHKMVNSRKLRRRWYVKMCYHGSWIHQSETADSQQCGHIASQEGDNQASLHTPVLPAHTAAGLLGNKMKSPETVVT